MKRFILDDLRKWRNSEHRKPLIIKGARQVGKTWILKEFGKEFPDGFAYFNFDKNEEFKQFFSLTKDVNRILENLAMASGQRITQNTLIIFDEIQECPEALNTLKYFCEEAPQYYVAAAGSLLGLMLSDSFPVGKVDFIKMGPMTFTEFLIANGDENLAQYLSSVNQIQNIPDAFFNQLEEKLKMYYVIGGMPEAVKIWTEEGDIREVDNVLSDILDSYEADFGKHAPIIDLPKIHLIWDSLPSQLARENKKFLYSAVKPGARAREYENALTWLKNANLINKVMRITKPGLPLSAYDDLDAFKIYMLDVGLLRKHSHLAISAFAEGTRLFTEFKGALTENFVYQSLIRQYDVVPRYWAEAPYEVDFIIQKENNILPIEAKAGINIKSTSIKRYAQQYENDTPLVIRLSLRNLSLDGRVLNVPLFMIDELDRVIGNQITLETTGGPS
jgi:uncharacterized protein